MQGENFSLCDSFKPKYFLDLFPKTLDYAGYLKPLFQCELSNISVQKLCVSLQDASPGPTRSVIHSVYNTVYCIWDSLVTQLVKNLPTMQETLVQFGIRDRLILKG